MPSPKEVREDRALQELVASLEPEVRDRIAEGEIEIRGIGEKGGLILVDSQTKRYVKGTDRPEGSADIAEIGRQNAFRNTKEYRAAWQRMFSLEGEDGAIGFDKLMERLWWAANGAKQLVECPHDGCGRRHVYAWKPDSKVLFQIAENLVSRAGQHLEVSGGVSHVHELIERASEDDSPVEVWSVNPQDPAGEAERRKQLALDEGIVEADWFEVKDS